MCVLLIFDVDDVYVIKVVINKVNLVIVYFYICNKNCFLFLNCK